MIEKEKIGYPSIDKPWLKYYENNIQLVDMPNKTLYEYAVDNNKDNLEGIAFRKMCTK